MQHVIAKLLIMSAPGSPGCTESSGGSDLMALLDQLLPSTAAAEKDDAISTAYMCAEQSKSHNDVTMLVLIL